ncbi:MAG: ATP-binding cassette domain-containing protein [Sphingobacteriaceae bacterium]|nr:ATP-binding cassette domain-containing protein [Sphingobacteriaceae bacterium]
MQHSESQLKKSNPEVVISIRGLYKSFGSNHVIKNFNLDVHQGENIVVLGKSGSGKSVLIKCIIGLIKPDAGSILVYGKDVAKMTAKELDKMRAYVGFLFQSNALYDSMSVRENLEFPLRRHRKNNAKQEIDALVHEALQNVGLEHTQEMKPAELSGGMRKRIALARTLILKPGIILYDEPTTGLDPITGKEISNLIVTLAKKYQTSSIIISHDLSSVKIVASKIVMLIDGQCYAMGKFEELQNSDDIKIKTFFE